MRATTTARSFAETKGGTGGVLAVAVVEAAADLSASTEASVDGSTVNAAGLTVTANRNGVTGQTDSTYASVVIGAVGVFIAVPVAIPTATDSGLVQALVTGGSVVSVAGAVTVAASATTSTHATDSGGQGTLGVQVAVGLITATSSADTTAAVGPDTGVTAGSLSVTASAVTPVLTNLFNLGIGLLTGAGAAANATSSGAVSAYIGTPVGGTAPVNHGRSASPVR